MAQIDENLHSMQKCTNHVNVIYCTYIYILHDFYKSFPEYLNQIYIIFT